MTTTATHLAANQVRTLLDGRGTGVLASVRWRPAEALAGFIGAGLTFSALTDTCGMARMHALLPHNRRGEPPQLFSLAIANIAKPWLSKNSRD